MSHDEVEGVACADNDELSACFDEMEPASSDFQFKGFSPHFSLYVCHFAAHNSSILCRFCQKNLVHPLVILGHEGQIRHTPSLPPQG